MKTLRASADRSSPAVLSENVPSRKEQLALLASSSASEPFDLLVIGGGATGTGVALDAVTRGLRVALVERDDFASGTSSKSTKLVHGGVRYLEKAFLQADLAQLKLVFEALAERATLLRNAPHLAWPLPILMPCYDWWEVPYYWAGLKAYDLVAGTSMLQLSRLVSADEACKMLPALAKKAKDGRTLKAALLYYDGQMDDARLNVALATSAARAGAAVVNHAAVTSLLFSGGSADVSSRSSGSMGKGREGRRVVGAVVRDEVGGGEEVEVFARVVVNATGVFCDRIRQLADPSLLPSVVASSGAHLVLPPVYLGEGEGKLQDKKKNGESRYREGEGERLDRGRGGGDMGMDESGSGSGLDGTGVGLIIPRTSDNRVMFMLPWLGRVVAGTTDGPAQIVDCPLPSQEEIGFILDTLGNYLDVEVHQGDVLSAWSGLRPLVTGHVPSTSPATSASAPSLASEAASTEGVVREHVVFSDASGLVTVTGGKWTTYRSMSEHTVDYAIQAGRLKSYLKASKSQTRGLKLTGGDSLAVANQDGTVAGVAAAKGEALKADESAAMGAAVAAGWDPAVLRHLAQSYGSRAHAVIAIAQAKGLSNRLAPPFPDIEAEVIFAAQNEFCATASDFLCRRSRLAFLDASSARLALPRVVQLLGKELGWSKGRCERERRGALAVISEFGVPAGRRDRYDGEIREGRIEREGDGDDGGRMGVSKKEVAGSVVRSG
ncbi:hypothetical protein CLOM_g5001 [Closterium sp. NIES-68]|nr:hypothetical protein CLOM_g5001 [Closterium sp. NIES-68]GJP67825.1 hypothetical protein CLOP_g24593 [Closterium sp. NIES-67]